MARLGVVYLVARRSLRKFLDDNCTQMAAAISYYVLFSLFPLLIFMVGVMGLVLQDKGLQKDVVNGVLDWLPLSEDKGRNEVTDAVRGVAGPGSGALGVLGLLGSAWAASALFGVIRKSLDRAYGQERGRPYVQQKLLDLAMVVGVGMFFLASIGATAFLRAARHFSGELAGLGELADRAGLVWDAVSLLAPFAFSFVAFFVLYWLVPAARVRPRDVWPGALVAAVLFEAAKVGFAVYLENFGNYDVVFGSLGAVATFLFWVYVSANILLLGAEVASVHRRLLRGEILEEVGEKPPLRQRLARAVRRLFVEEREEGRPS